MEHGIIFVMLLAMAATVGARSGATAQPSCVPTADGAPRMHAGAVPPSLAANSSPALHRLHRPARGLPTRRAPADHAPRSLARPLPRLPRPARGLPTTPTPVDHEPWSPPPPAMQG
ncbi:vegetative cell wall protein gp1 [Triticum aestivum]|uniref:vegetative cell wall protein gp1 n=1 Tax=Triticum aestivum TaxID=4565 RepID=UPI001D00AF2B|nr:vegetative cell wall protein gp1-like [Triticum aestivum]